MKKTILSLCILLISIFSTIGQTNNNIISPPKVDKRVELLSIVFRLAGNDEYNMDSYKSYVNDIHTYFDKYKKHPAIKFATLLRKTKWVSYHKVMSMAIHLEQPPSLKLRVPFNDSILSQQWGMKSANKFVRLLQQFYTDTKCEVFFKAHETMYRKAEERFNVVFDSLDIGWYKNFYGKVPDGSFNIIIGLSNGGCNYATKFIHTDKKEEMYAMMGTWSIDSLEMPIYTAKGYLPTLIHEFNHSFVNQLIAINQTQLESSGKIIFKQVEAIMKSQAYGSWEFMMDEALVRASVIMYLKKHETNKNIIEEELNYEFSRGFMWIKELVDLLDQYEKERNTYPTLESFMPQIISFYQTTANNIITIKEDYVLKSPHILAIQPFENNAKNVVPTITEIKILFDKPLVGKGYSLYFGNYGKDYNPITGLLGYSDDNKTITLKVALKANKEYHFILTGNAFKTKEGFPLENYEVKFKTGK